MEVPYIFLFGESIKMKIFELNAQLRTDLGKGASRRLRRTEHVPAIIYGAGKKPVSLTLSHNELLRNLEHEAFYSRILTVNIDNQPEKAVLKDLQRHPYRPLITHLDLLRVSENKKLHMHIPLHFIHEEKCPGVKQDGGVVSHYAAEIEIRCLPKNLPEFIEVDLQNVVLNQILHLSDLVLPSGVELAKAAVVDIPLVSVHLPRGVQTDEEKEAEDIPEEAGKKSQSTSTS